MILRAEGLTREFSTGFLRRGRHRALDDVTFELARGEVFGLLGPNGAGKSTTLKLITGLLRPTAGRVVLFDATPAESSARARLGFLPEHPAFAGHLTGEELLTYFAGLYGVPTAARASRVSAWLERVGLGAVGRRPLRQYSKGMVQRLGLAQALIHDPELIVLDEPMSGLDPAGRRDVRNLILELRDAGRTVLFSSHILTDAELLCTRVAMLRQGRLVAMGSTAELTAAHAQGWEVTASGLTPAAVAALQTRAVRVTRVAHGRYTFVLAPDVRPEDVVAAIASHGGVLDGVAPIKASLEDVFLERVS